jgi:late competence protein required for DNA uptake (superfamily II DNA/RNA helicase)
MCIVTGPRIDLAITLIDRMKRLFTDNGLVTFDSKETVIDLNGVHIEAYPSHHLDAMRGLSDVSFVLLDEADFFPTRTATGCKRCFRQVHCKIKSLNNNGINS